MNTLQQRVEIQMSLAENDDLAVEDELVLRKLPKTCYQFRKVPAQWLSRFGLQQNLVVLTKHQTAKAVPFRLVQPFAPFPQGDRIAWLHTVERRLKPEDCG